MTINELIATSSVHAFNSGVESGRASERDRIIALLNKNGRGPYHTIRLTPTLMVQILKGEDND